MSKQKPWLALEIGNSRLHWGLFVGETLDCTWNTDYLPDSVIQQLGNGQTLDDFPAKIFTLPSPLPLAVASVVPSQTVLWQTYSNVRVITLEDVPLNNTYPTLGIDRALALWGAGRKLGFPILVIDAGTALTFTGADHQQNLVGGAILPGFGLQFASLGQRTSQLPHLETQNFTSLPPRFAQNTPAAIQSGVIYTLLAGIKDFITDWWKLFPNSRVAIKGGDRTLVIQYLQTLYPEIAARLIVEPNLIFWGIQLIFNINE
ncbi:pantothenate kinase [Nostoc sp. LEGE 06077]|uniref:pantothenate kinase n=1 Tax=Nostoc sp. LEGE 06077 TaxID=915325 RepID=UPI00187DE177|nr:pantothenate kinase [Nostoc sp. LEGE 06077]MBE9210433.1 pantothenate kinase [Nostoc sp. LEGE 06077]